MSHADKVSIMKKMVNLSEDFKKALINNNLSLVGNLLNDNWSYKKQLAGKITNTVVDELYNKTLSLGAIGGKLLGAGGSGFLLVMADNHKLIKNKLNCRSLEVKIDKLGSTIIYSQ